MTNPFAILSSREVYDNPWISLTEHAVRKPRGGEGIYGVVHFKNRAVGVVPYADGKVWLVGQHRFPLDAYSWEIPAGGAPFHEELEVCALRELAEETGLVASQLQKLFSMHLSNSVTDELAHVYLATELREGASHWEDTEELRVCTLSVDELLQRVLAGEITDSMTVAAAFRLKLMQLDGTL
ncbi:MAG TPA: NUDIX hydrolase [Polyangiales bacterium]|nr:NUDIX hydrolase [Polyangiales bacterium]